MRAVPARLEGVLRVFMAFLALVALVLLVVENGFHLRPEWRGRLAAADVGIAVGFVLQWAVRLWLAPMRWRHACAHFVESFLVVLLAVQLLFLVLPAPAREVVTALRAPGLTKIYLVLLQVYLVVQALLRANETIIRIGIRPPIVILASFVLLVLVGTFLLMLPRCAADPARPVRPVDAFFTSTSAVCVTGLTVADTGKDFSERGQWVILALIQVGGLGLVTFTALFLLLSRRGLGVRQSLMLGEASAYNVVGEIGRFLAYVVSITLIVELLGAVVLFGAWNEPGMSDAERARWSLFHSVSAFCNAGFGLKTNNFVDYASNVRVNLTLMALVTIGGIGFAVIMNVLRFRIGTLPLFRRMRWIRRKRSGEEISRLTIHSKAALWMSALLLFLGTAGFWALESGGVLRGRPAGDQFLISLFHSVNCRTSGFNSVDVSALRVPTLTVMIALMVVGASPGSTGGGVKTVGVVILFATLVAMIRNREHVELHQRTIPRTIVNQAVTVIVLYGMTAFFISTALSITDPGIPYYKTLFETVSALSTVGLSTGITPTLSVAGKLLLCLAMGLGRVGPLVVLMSIAGRRTPLGYEYPSEEVAVA